MFLQVSVCPQRGVPGPRGRCLVPGGPWSRECAWSRGVCLVPGGAWSWGVGIPACTQAETPPGETATAADGTHSTGMHSCFTCRPSAWQMLLTPWPFITARKQSLGQSNVFTGVFMMSLIVCLLDSMFLLSLSKCVSVRGGVSVQGGLCPGDFYRKVPPQNQKSGPYASYWNAFLLPSTMKLQRLCFYTCLSVHRRGDLPQCILEYHTPPRSRHLPRSRHPQDQTSPTRTRHPLSRRLLLRTVRILLECILVRNMLIKFLFYILEAYTFKVFIIFP